MNSDGCVMSMGDNEECAFDVCILFHFWLMSFFFTFRKREQHRADMRDATVIEIAHGAGAIVCEPKGKRRRLMKNHTNDFASEARSL